MKETRNLLLSEKIKKTHVMKLAVTEELRLISSHACFTNLQYFIGNAFQSMGHKCAGMRRTYKSACFALLHAHTAAYL